MTINFNDQRAVKTEEKIQTAFWTLLSEKGYEQIKINDLLQHSGINRTTFYAHYSNKDDLLDQLEQTLLQGIQSSSIPLTLFELKYKKADTLANLNAHLDVLIAYVYEHRQKVALLLSNKGDPRFVHKLLVFETTYWQTKQLTNHLTVPATYFFSGLIGMIVNLVIKWGQNQFRESPQEFKKVVVRMVMPIILSDNIFE